MRCVCSILLLVVASPALSDEVPQKGSSTGPTIAQRDAGVREDIAKLASPSFEERRNAFLSLWNAGEAILPTIEQATLEHSESSPANHRQLRDSLGTLQLLHQLQIPPGQASESLHLIELINDVTPPKIVEMCRLRYWDLATQLVRSNDLLHETLSDSYGRYALNQIVDAAFDQGDLSKAWPIVSNTIPSQQAAWIAKKLELELPAQENESLDAKAIRLFCAGDTEASLACVQSPMVQANIVTRGFRWQELSKQDVRLAIVGNTPSVSQSAAEAVLLEIAGEVEKADALWTKNLSQDKSEAAETDTPADQLDAESQVALKYLRQLADPIDGNVAQLNQFTLALIMSGRTAPVERFLEETNKAFAFSFHAQVSKFAQAFEQVGLRPDLSNFDEWLEQQLDNTPKTALRSQRRIDELLPRTALTLLNLGHKEKATEILQSLAGVAQSEPRAEVEIWIDHIARWFSRHEARALCLELAEKNAPFMSSECIDKLTEDIFSELGSAAAALFATAPELADHPNASAWKKLERLRLWDRDYFGPNCETIVSRWLREAKLHLARETLSSDQLSQLGQVAHDFGYDDLSLEILATDLRDVLGDSTPNLHWLDTVAIYNEQLKPKSALPLLASIRNLGYNLQTAYISEVDTLLMAGEYDLADILDRSRWMRPLAMENYEASYYDIAKHYADREDYERAAQYAEPAFLFAEPNSRFSYGIALQYAELAEAQHDFRLHANVQRTLLVEGLQQYSELLHIMMLNGYLSSMRMLAHNERLSRAVVCIEEQDFVAARRHLNVANKLEPQDINVVVECFPRLVDAGQQEFATELLVRYETVLRTQIAAWPEDSTALNNLAWMFSQCDYKLEEALELAQRGVSLAPLSPVFLDTLAEIEYRLGRVEQALGTMRECVRLDPRDSHYRENVVRFRQDLD